MYVANQICVVAVVSAGFVVAADVAILVSVVSFVLWSLLLLVLYVLPQLLLLLLLLIYTKLLLWWLLQQSCC
jgi:hypothetical protein